MRYKEFYSTKKQGVAEDLEQKFKFYYSVFTHDEMQDFKERDQLDASGSPLVDMDEDEITISASSVSEAYQKLLQHFPNQAVFVHSSTPIEQGVAEGSLNEFAIDNDGRNDGGKFISWKKFIEQLKQILAKDFDVNENIIKDTIKANFIPHDPMEFGPTVLYSYYDRRPGRNSGAFSTRGAIQVGKYFPGLRTGENKLLTAFNILKGHPFERQFDLTFDNIYKIANIIKGNTKGAYQMQSQGVAEATGDEKFDTMLGNIVKDTPTDFVLSHPVTGELFKRGFTTREQAKAYNQQKEQGYYSVYSYQWWRDEIEPEIPSSQKKGMAEGNIDEILSEKAKSKAQQRFFGMAHALQKGEKIPGASKELTKVAKTMGKKDVKDFAKTKRKGLPAHVKKD